MYGASKHDASRGGLNRLLHTLAEGNPEKERFVIVIGDPKRDQWLLEFRLDQLTLADLLEHFSYWHPEYAVQIRRDNV